LTTINGRQYTLSITAPSVIGSRGSAILLAGMGVEAQHARLTPSGGGFTIEPVMGTVLVNGAPISSAVGLTSGAVITLGSQTLTYTGPTSAPLARPVTPPPSMTAAKPLAPFPSSSKSSAPAVKIPAAWPTFGQPKPPILEGQILVVDGPHAEAPDIDWAGLILRGIGGLILLPLACWQPALVIPFLLYGLGQRNPQVPTRYLRVEDQAGKQYVVRMKGDPQRGMLSQGDQAAFWGRWEGGNLSMERAWNQKTNSEVRLKPVVQRKTSQTILFILIGLVIVLWIWAASAN
jgi:hypothetical protein